MMLWKVEPDKRIVHDMHSAAHELEVLVFWFRCALCPMLVIKEEDVELTRLRGCPPSSPCRTPGHHGARLVHPPPKASY
jgi:hypothetical protein